jgi:OOP family OmpA-OmpF porin
LDLPVDALVDELVAGVCKRLALVPRVEGAVDFYRARIRDNSLSPADLRFGGPNNAVNTLLYHIDAIYHFMPDQKFVPFVVAGIGGAHFDPNSTGDKNKLMADVGVGAKYWLTDNTALRMDIRDVAYIGSLKQNLEATLGLVIAFGGQWKPEPAPAPAPVPAPKPEPKPEPKKEVVPAAAKVEPASIVLEDVHFDFDKATLTDAAKAIIAKNIVVIKANPGIAIRIEGNTCQHGADDYNMRLDERRASVVKEYLAKEGGINESRMTTISYGETRPLCEEKPTPKNKNPECMKSNRRVHFEVVVK